MRYCDRVGAVCPRVAFASGLLSLLVLTSGAVRGHALVTATPLINYQAKLTDSGGNPVSGTHTMYFSIYLAGNEMTSGSGTLQFSESASVGPIGGGVVNHAIGSGTNIFGSSLGPDKFSTTTEMYLEVAIDSAANVILPRTRLAYVPLAFRAGQAANSDLLNGLPSSAFLQGSHNHDGVYIKATGGAHVAVDTTDSATTNGENLLAAYDTAKNLAPNGQALSATNRATVLVMPGNYDLGSGQLAMDTEFVDVVGVSGNRDDQYIHSTTNGDLTGVLRQIANDVHIENLLIQSTRSGSQVFGLSNEPAAYFPNSDTTATVLRNCEFRDKDGTGMESNSMRGQITYSGTYIDVTGGLAAFGYGGTASGYFKNCRGGINSFGTLGVASGTFVDCVGDNATFGYSGVTSGNFTRCTGGNYAFGGLCSGTFIDCSGGTQAFGYFQPASGTFTNCHGGQDAFAVGSSASGTFTGCIGGAYSFGSGGSANGTFVNCSGDNFSFGGIGGSTVGGRLTGCKMTGASTWGSTFSGRMENCYWGSGFKCAPSARIYGSTIAGTLDLDTTATGVCQTRAKDIINEGLNVFGASSAAAFNIEGTNVN